MGKLPALNKKAKHSNNPNRRPEKGNMRSKSTIMRLNMYNEGKAIRNKKGKIVGGSLLMNNTAGGQKLPNAARIAPDRRWFGNTRVIAQKELDSFREEMTAKSTDPYSVVIRRKKVPLTLLHDSEKATTLNLLETESFEGTFGNKQTRKRPKLAATITDYESLLDAARTKEENYNSQGVVDSNIELETDGAVDARKDDLFAKGQSKRIWAELYKVLDCSDVVIQVVDARNVPGTRCTHIERHLKKNAAHKHLITVINKCDLAPSWVTRKWVKILSEQFPTLAFHASITNAFGKGALITLLRQFAKLHSDKRQISVGVIGYPNTGKSSLINALLGKASCKAAPVPGETKVWQYLTLTKRIFLIDSPGVVYDIGDDEIETVLKGVVRAERLENPADFIEPILQRVQIEHLQKHYNLDSFVDAEDFLTKLAIQQGKLLKGGEADCAGIAKRVIYDWQRGKLPYFVPPPKSGDDEDPTEQEISGDEEMCDEGNTSYEVEDAQEEYHVEEVLKPQMDNKIRAKHDEKDSGNTNMELTSKRRRTSRSKLGPMSEETNSWDAV